MIQYKFDETAGEQHITGVTEETPETPEVETPEVETPEVETPETPEVETPETLEVETPETPQVEIPETPEVETPEVETPQTTNVTESNVLDFLNKKHGTDFKTFDEYKRSLTPETPKTPEAPKLDEETQKFLRFQNETKGTFKDWVKLNENLDDKSSLELAVDKIQRDNEGLQLTENQAYLLLTEELGIDAEELDELSDKDKLKLSAFANKHKKDLKAEQDKWNKALDSAPETTKTQPSGETVVVNGKELPKAEYDLQRKTYLESREAAVNAIDKFGISFEVEGKDGSKSNIDLNYDVLDEAKQSMLAVTESVDNVLMNYLDKDNNFDHKSFNEDIGFWANKELREKVLQTFANQAYAAGVDAVMKEKNNITDMNHKPIPKSEPKTPEGYGKIGERRNTDGLSVKYAFNE